MHPSLKAAFDQLEAQRLHLFKNLQEQQIEALLHRLEPDSWTTLQILRHLIIAESRSVQYLRKKLQYQEVVKPVTLLERVKARLLIIWLKSPLKRKAPPGVDQFEEDFAADPVWRGYDDVRMQMAETLSTIPDELLSGQLFKHPIVGKMTIFDALEFFEEHFARHERQIQKILKDYAR